MNGIVIYLGVITIHIWAGSTCSEIFKIFSVWTVRCSCCSLEISCSACSVFGLFAQNKLFGQFGVRSTYTVRRSLFELFSLFKLFGENEVFGPVHCQDCSSCSVGSLFRPFVKFWNFCCLLFGRPCIKTPERNNTYLFLSFNIGMLGIISFRGV